MQDQWIFCRTCKAQDDLPDVGIVCLILTVCDGKEKIYCWSEAGYDDILCIKTETIHDNKKFIVYNLFSMA